MMRQKGQMENMSKKTWWLIVVAVAILAGIIWYAAARNGAQAPGGTGGAAGQPKAGVPVFAAKGDLTPGFPQSLILDPNAAIAGSYAINYSSTTNQYTAQWNSSSSMLTLYNAYKQYLPAHGWRIVNDLAKYPISRGLAAQSTSSNVSVAIVAQAHGSQISVTFLAK